MWCITPLVFVVKKCLKIKISFGKYQFSKIYTPDFLLHIRCQCGNNSVPLCPHWIQKKTNLISLIRWILSNKSKQVISYFSLAFHWNCFPKNPFLRMMHFALYKLTFSSYQMSSFVCLSSLPFYLFFVPSQKKIKKNLLCVLSSPLSTCAEEKKEKERWNHFLHVHTNMPNNRDDDDEKTRRRATTRK